MKTGEFRLLLEWAVVRDAAAVEEILIMYEPLIAE